MDLGRETRVQCDGKTWTIGRMTVRAILELGEWVASRVGDPFSALERFGERMSAADFKAEFDRARAVRDQLNKFSLDTSLAREALATEVGSAALLAALMRPHHPDVTLDDALAVLVCLGPKAGELLARSAGRPVPNADPASPPAGRTPAPRGGVG